MAWNGSDKPAAPKAPAHPPRAARAHSPLRGLVAGLVIVLGGAAALFLLTRDLDERPASGAAAAGRLADATPAVVTNAPAAKPAPEPKKIDPNARPTKVGEKLNGYIMLPSGKLHKIKGEIYNNSSAAIKGEYEIFDYACENEIATFLMMPPGDTLVGTPRYNGRFKAEFLESLKHPIVTKADDSDKVKDLKRAVTDAKIAMKDALDRGEDIEQMMYDARKELQDLAAYKLSLRGQLNDISRTEGMTVEDMEDYVTAANKMLESKGIAPMEFGPLVRRKLQLELEQSQHNGVNQ